MNTRIWPTEYQYVASLFALLALAVVACSSRPTGSAEPIEPFPTTERTAGECALAIVPAQLPPVDAIVDTTVLSSLVERKFTDAGSVTISIVFTGVSAHPTTAVHESELDQLTVAAVKEAVDSTLKLRDSATGPWAVRLQITTGDRLSYGVLRSEYCPPTRPEDPVRNRMVSEGMSERELNQMLRRSRERNSRDRRLRLYQAKCLIDPDGNVSVIEVIRSTGNSDDDQSLGRRLRRVLFRPATLDGVPVAGWWVGR